MGHLHGLVDLRGRGHRHQAVDLPGSGIDVLVGAFAVQEFLRADTQGRCGQLNSSFDAHELVSGS
ncbi:hypothetical protein [Glutamicibacter protophormiae]